jgi:hypothetical protein
MTDAFSDYIQSMSDSRYEDWLDDRATDSQRTKALMIRTPLSQQELEYYEREQEYIPETESKTTEVYDNIDLKLPYVEYLPTAKIQRETVKPQKYRSEQFKPTIERQILEKRPSIQLPYTRAKVENGRVTFFQKLRRIFTIRKKK